MIRPAAPPLARLRAVSLRRGGTVALRNLDLELPAGCLVGVIGPDGVGKSSLLALLAGAQAMQQGQLEVMGGDMRQRRHRAATCPRIAYMPQGLGRNLYPTLSVRENVDFFGRLFGHDRDERQRRIDGLLAVTGLAPFAERPAGQLSGGMKQKLGLCCALIHDPDLLILDEPTTGVDPLSRRRFWQLIRRLRDSRPALSVVVATAYMEEAAGFDWLIAMDGGRILAGGTPAALLEQTGAPDLESAFVRLLPPERRAGHAPLVLPPPLDGEAGTVALEATDLSMRFGDFTAVDRVSFRIRRGEIFGFLGSNGCGKTTTMKMLTGLLPPSAGEARLFGRPVDPRDMASRRRVGYMSQSFSLYGELTVRQNLELHARLFAVAAAEIPARVAEMADRFELAGFYDALPGSLALGQRQRLSLAVAMIHRPEVLILDEPTSGVDPVARDAFWRLLVRLSREDGVTIFISTHFMNEAERCDRVSLMHAGRVLVSDSPAALRQSQGAETLEEAFVAYLEAADGGEESLAPAPAPQRPARRAARGFDPARMLAYARRETMELRRDPLRLTLALLGSVILLFVMGYGISLDVENLSFAVLDRDDTRLSRDYADNLAGSRYFDPRPPLTDHADLDRRMRAGELSVAIEIPPGFARKVDRGDAVEIAAWVDAAMPTRAETALGYVRGLHGQWLAAQARERGLEALATAPVSIETRFRYNPGVKSLVAMVPAMIPLLLMLIPAMLAALSMVREKETGSVVNLYVTPVTRAEYLFGKQLPYLGLALMNFAILAVLAVTAFGVPLTGSLPALVAGAALYVLCSTAIGLLISSFVRSQVAAVFGTAVLSILPAVSFSGMLDPVSSLQGIGRLIGEVYPTSHFLVISRGAFSKGLGFAQLWSPFLALALAAPLLSLAALALLRKQAR